MFIDKEDLREDMEEKGIGLLSEYDEAAVLTQSNHGGLALLVNEPGDGVFVSKEYGQEEDEVEIVEEEIVSGEDGSTGFYFEGDFYRLDEFMSR